MTLTIFSLPPAETKQLLGLITFCVITTSPVIGNYFVDDLRNACLCNSQSQCGAGQSSFTLHPVVGVAAGHILLSRDTSADQSRTGMGYRCKYTIVAPRAMAVSIRINSVNIPLLPASAGADETGMARGTYRGCGMGALQIYDGNTTNNIGKQLIEMCGSVLPPEITFVSTSGELTLYYFESADIEQQSKSFNLTFTYFALRRTGCSSNEFECLSNAHCIANSLLCDGIDNCFDGSDESSDFDSCGRFRPSSNPFVGTAVGVGLFMFFGLLLCVAAARVKKQRQLGNNAARTLRGTTSGDSAMVTCLSENDSSDHNLSSAAGRPTHPSLHNGVLGNDITAASDIPYSHRDNTFQPLILVSGSHHVTLVAMPPSSDLNVRCTPPPPYELLFPDRAPSYVENA